MGVFGRAKWSRCRAVAFSGSFVGYRSGILLIKCPTSAGDQVANHITPGYIGSLAAPKSISPYCKDFPTLYQNYPSSVRACTPTDVEVL